MQDGDGVVDVELDMLELVDEVLDEVDVVLDVVEDLVVLKVELSVGLQEQAEL